jgi:uncharacterized membrane protein YfcA
MLAGEGATRDLRHDFIENEGRLRMTSVLTLGVVFAAVLMQSLVGFGSAMVAMALLPYRLGLPVAAPLVALIAATLEALVLVRYRESLNWRAIWQLSMGMVAGVPLGVLALSRVEARILLPVLGGVIVAYALYALLDWRLPELRDSRWAFGFGLLAGLLGGAYNVSGPPVIAFGHCRRWPPPEFKGNLQAFFLVGDALVVVGHAAMGNLTSVVWRNYLLALPAIALGVVAGLALDRFIRPQAFRRLALIVLVVLGTRLLF